MTAKGKMAGREMKFVFWLALILTFSPGEKEPPARVSGFADDLSTNQRYEHFKPAAKDSPSPWGEGRDEGELHTD